MFINAIHQKTGHGGEQSHFEKHRINAISFSHLVKNTIKKDLESFSNKPIENLKHRKILSLINVSLKKKYLKSSTCSVDIVEQGNNDETNEKLRSPNAKQTMHSEGNVVQHPDDVIPELLFLIFDHAGHCCDKRLRRIIATSSRPVATMLMVSVSTTFKIIILGATTSVRMHIMEILV
ncbi:hypothetical protein T4C_11627 [Trichinella pseudospiralis]|uniref:Uncharacterized protein n=1 Tax=Trichinella pseudospiralis TaxID=6337 RepID=A0A0V1K027_TRIPS|nr:hypothetical protein T4C_11627 [Trichinella pseudospiralis]